MTPNPVGMGIPRHSIWQAILLRITKKRDLKGELGSVLFHPLMEKDLMLSTTFSISASVILTDIYKFHDKFLLVWVSQQPQTLCNVNSKPVSSLLHQATALCAYN